MALDLAQDHPSIGWGNWPAQFAEASSLEAVVRALLSPMDGIQSALSQLYSLRWLGSASGAQLDGIGDILGRPRQITDVTAYHFFGFQGQDNIGGFGQYRMYTAGLALSGGSSALDDDAYRLLLAWKVSVDAGYGTVPQIEAAVAPLFQAERISVEDIGAGAIKVHIGKTTDNNVFLGNPLKWIRPAAGVSATYQLYEAGEAFEFSA